MRRLWGILLLILGGPLVAAPWQPFTTLTLSADGKALATGGIRGEVLWREVLTGEVLGIWDLGGELPVVGLAFDPDGRKLGVVLLDGRGFILSLGLPVPQTDQLTDTSWNHLPESVSRWMTSGTSMAGIQLATPFGLFQGFPDGRITVRPSDPTVTPVAWQAHQAAVTGLAWCPQNSTLFSCAYDGTLSQWDARTGKLLTRL